MKVIGALVFVLLVNILFFYAQLGIADVNPLSTAPVIMNYSNSMMANYDKGGYTLRDFEAGDLPTPEAQVDTEGNFFTDIYSTVKNWLLDLPGVSPLVGLVSAVPNFLKVIGLPPAIAYSLGFLWHALSVFLIVAFLKG